MISEEEAHYMNKWSTNNAWDASGKGPDAQ